jgi:hypothetical protein
MRRGRESDREETQYNWLIAVWAAGLVIVFALKAVDTIDVSVGTLWTVLYPVAVLAIWRHRSQLKSTAAVKSSVMPRTGLRLMFVGLGALMILFLAEDALLNLFPVTYDLDVRDLVFDHWAHVGAALLALWGGYLYFSAKHS